MEGREWLYFLLDTDGRSYYIQNGILHISSSPRPLTYGPDGWKDISIGWERDLETWGNVINFSLPLTYVLDGAQILRTIIDTTNIETVVRLLIQRQSLFIDNGNYYRYYRFFYRGEIDLSTYEDDGETSITVNVMEGGLNKNIKALKSTAYSFEPNDVLIKMDGATMVGSKKFIVLDTSYAHGVNGAFTVKEMLPMYEAITEGNFFNIYFKQSVASPVDINYSYVDDEDLTKSDKYNALSKASVSIKQIKLSGTVGWKGVTGARVGVDFFLEKINGTTSTVIPLFSLNHNWGSGDATPYKFELTTGPIGLNENDTYFIWHRPNANQNSNRWYFLENTFLDMLVFDKVPTTYVKAKSCFNLFSDLINKIDSSTGKAVSTLLQSKSNLVVTSGDALRGITGAKLKTSLSAFLKSFNVILNTGSGVLGNNYVLEKKEFFLKDENVIALGQIQEGGFKRKLPTDIMGNVVKIGYQPKDSDDVNGKYSFNNTNVYTSPIKKVVRDISLVSDYVTDPYVIELYRANLEGKKTTDDSKDDMVCVLNIDYANPKTLTQDTGGYPAGTVYYDLKRTVYDSIEGVEEGSFLYNIDELTPARLMEVHRNYLDSLFYQFVGQKLTFQTASKNENLKTVLGSTVYDENADYMIGQPTLFKTVVFELVVSPKDNTAEILTDNPNRCFSFIHPNGKEYRGFNLKVGIAANTEDEQNFELLAVANQDLTTLKNV